MTMDAAALAVPLEGLAGRARRALLEAPVPEAVAAAAYRALGGEGEIQRELSEIFSSPRLPVSL